MSTRMTLAGLGLFLFIGVPGCGMVNFDEFTSKDTISKTFAAKEPPRVMVDTVNGHIHVTVTEQNQVHAEVTRHAGAMTQEEADAALKEMQVNFHQEGDTIHIAVQVPRKLQVGNRGADVDVQVPAKTVLELETSNGPISVTGLAAGIKATSSNGGISVKGSRGDVTAHTRNGSIHLEGTGGRLDLRTSNGGIDVASERKPQITAQTTNGRIRFAGTLADGEHVFETSNGKIDLTLPAQGGFAIDASTSHGHISSEFALDDEPTSGNHHLRARMGDHPAVKIRAETTNGSIEIHKAQPPKS